MTGRERGTRDQLAEAVEGHRPTVSSYGVKCSCGWYALCGDATDWEQHVADALLPVVEQIAAQRAADELRSAAGAEYADHGYRFLVRRDDLRARADALDPFGADRQHTASADCWCGPVADGIGWRHR